MIPDINTCPKCDALVLDDTVVCPNCQYNFKPELEGAEEIFASPVEEKSEEQVVGQHEVQCNTCGESVREGSVRCWNCGSFLQEEIESHFLQMQARPAEIITSDPDDAQADVVDAVDFSDEEYLGDDDFELSEGFDVADFELSESAPQTETEAVAEADAGEEEDQSIPMLDDNSSEGYALATPSSEQDAQAEPTEESAEEPASVPEEDPLLNLAMQEEQETQKRFQKQSVRMRKQTVLLKCSNCKSQIRVPLYNQGKIGRCPKCMMQFVVPVLKKPEEKSETSATAAAETPAIGQWMTGKWNQFATSKRPKKALALATKGEEIDLHVGQHGLLLLWPDEKPGLMKSAAKLRGEIKTKINQHLTKDAASAEFPAKRFLHFSAKTLSELKLIIDDPKAEEPVVSLYAPGQIALSVPHTKTEKEKEEQTTELVLSLTSYRLIYNELKSHDIEVPFHLENIVPVNDETTERECAFSNEKFQVLKSPEYYEADPAFQLEPAGWSCQSCEAVVSEESRIEQSFGGKKPKGLAKAKCPKCEQPFGNQPLWEFKKETPEEEKVSSSNDTVQATPAETPSEETPAPEQQPTA